MEVLVSQGCRLGYSEGATSTGLLIISDKGKINSELSGSWNTLKALPNIVKSTKTANQKLTHVISLASTNEVLDYLTLAKIPLVPYKRLVPLFSDGTLHAGLLLS